MNNEGDIGDIKIIGGNAEGDAYGIHFEIKGLNYDSSEEIFGMESFTANTNIYVKELGLTIEGVKISENKVDFDSIKGSVSDEIDFGNFKLSNSKVTFNKTEGKLSAKSNFKYEFENILEGSANVGFTLNDKNELETVTVEGGNVKGDVYGIHFNIEGLSYDSSKKKFGIKTLSAKADIFGTELDLTSKGITIDKTNKLDFEEISGTINEVKNPFFNL